MVWLYIRSFFGNLNFKNQIYALKAKNADEIIMKAQIIEWSIHKLKNKFRLVVRSSDHFYDSACDIIVLKKCIILNMHPIGTSKI